MSLFKGKLKRLHLGCFMMLLLPSAAHAVDTLAMSIGFGGTTSEPSEIGNAGYATVWAGAISSRYQVVGPYIHAAVPYSQVTNQSRDINSVSRVTAGLTYSASSQITLYGGTGWAYQRVKPYSLTQSGYTQNHLNFNAGLLLHFTSEFGLNLGFDSKPQGVNLGVVYKFH